MEIERILVATDLSPQAETAVDQAARIARRTGARLTLLHARHGQGEAPPELADQCKRASAGGVETSTRVVSDDPADAIVDAARQLASNLVVVGTHGRTGFSRMLLGSVAERVVRNARTSVMIARPGREGADFERILVPTDFSDQAEAALQTALMLARPGATVDLFHCWLPPSILPVSGGAMPVRRARPGEESATSAEPADALGAALADRYRNEHVGLSFAHSEDAPVRGIHRQLETGVYDCVVIGSHGRRGLRRWLLGSVAEPTVRYAPCSAVVVRVPGHHEPSR